MTLRHFVNDGLMAIFFFVIGLELKRGMLVGELSNIMLAAWPLVVAWLAPVFPGKHLYCR
ncbi:MAG TPA: Na+/H+ antiporter NhaA [Methylophilus sp.]|nr:Na+/H+ antiporter NhaA [Methylophilus sp.]HQQ33114.1 Na+/H+ antiporter NhaA [Methylophilus sp.]